MTCWNTSFPQLRFNLGKQTEELLSIKYPNKVLEVPCLVMIGTESHPVLQPSGVEFNPAELYFL